RKLAGEGPFQSLWTQPAAGDAGGALGAALWFWHHQLKQPRVVQQPDGMRGAFLGPNIAAEFTSDKSAGDEAVLRRLGATSEDLDDAALAARIADAIEAGKVVAV